MLQIVAFLSKIWEGAMAAMKGQIEMVASAVRALLGRIIYLNMKILIVSNCP